MVEKLTEINLASIKLQETRPRSIGRQGSTTFSQEDDVETAVGQLHVAVQGDRSRPAIITYHDIGLNSTSCFGGFFNYEDMQPILRHFCVYHINAPGQQDGAMSLMNGGAHQIRTDPLTESPDDEHVYEDTVVPQKPYQYPTMDQLADMVLPVLQFYQIRRFIGFGVGAGANILSRFALSHPQAVDALFLVNPTCGKCGWTEWGYQKLNAYYMKSGSLTDSAENYLLWHLFGEKTMDENHDLVHVYKEHLKSMNPHNLGMFIESYSKRTDLCLIVPSDHTKKLLVRNLRCSVMLLTGDDSPHVDSTVTMNSKLDHSKAAWMKISDCGGMPLEEQPEKVCDAFRLFLQGEGHVPMLSQTRIMNERASQHQGLVIKGSK